METKQFLPPTHPITMMKNQLVKFLPLLAISIAAPAVAASNYFERHPGGVQIADNQMGKRENRLNLTPAQKTKMQQLRASARSQMEAILTPEQQQQAKARQERRQAMRNTWKSLNLTTDQQAKIKTIRQSSRQQLDAILTPEQQDRRKSQQRSGGGRANSI